MPNVNSPAKKSSISGFVDAGELAGIGVRKSSLRQSVRGEPPEKKSRADSPDIDRSRSPVVDGRRDMDGVSVESGSVNVIPPLPGFSEEGKEKEEGEKEKDGSKDLVRPPGIPDQFSENGNERGNGSSDVSLQSIMSAITNVNSNLDNKFVAVEQKFGIIESAFETLHKELSEVKEKMVSKEMFDSLASRVAMIELNPDGKIGSEVSSLRKQLARLDPAHRSIRIAGFELSQTEDRMKFIEESLSKMSLPKMVSIDHLYKGPAGNRSLSSSCLVEFASRAIREQVLGKFQGSSIKDSKQGELQFSRAKTQTQLSRNAALRDAAEILKKDSRVGKLPVEIIWQKTDKKDRSREVQVNSTVVFSQSKDDLSGQFLGKFADLQI